jgi:hypothetical protein
MAIAYESSHAAHREARNNRGGFGLCETQKYGLAAS